MKGLRIHWTLHPDKQAGMYRDDSGKPRSRWYDAEIRDKHMSPSAVARELDISYEMSVEGIVYPEFRDSHILKSAYEINPMLPVIRFFDYGRVNCSTFAQKTVAGSIIFFKELILRGSSTDAQAKAVVAYSATLPTDKFVDYDDPSGSYADVNTGSIAIEIMQEKGIWPTHKKLQSDNKRLKSRTELLKMKLSERIGADETILIHKNCQTIIDAFQSGYRYNENYNGEILDSIKEEHPFEDAIDCVAGTVFEEYSVGKGSHEYDLAVRRPNRNKYTGY